MKNTFSYKLVLPLFVAFSLITVSCISNVENTFPSQVQVGLEMERLDTMEVISDDSITVESVQLVQGDSYMIIGGDSLFFNNSERVISFNPGALQFANPVRLAGGQFPPGAYEEIALALPKASENIYRQNPDFIKDNKRFTIVAKGTYNGEQFTYQSERVIEQNFSFTPPIQVPEDNASFIFVIRANVVDWFVDFNGSGIFDPRDAGNSTGINKNIENSFRLQQLQP